MKILSVIIASLALVFASKVSAAEFAFNQTTATLTISGSIEQGDRDIFRSISYYTRIENILLVDSNGGVFDEAMDIAIDILASRINTGAAGTCLSACAYIWLAGDNRFIFDRTTNLGIHAPYHPDGKELEYRIVSKYVWFMEQVGIDPILTEIIFATGPSELVGLNPKNVSDVLYLAE